MFSNYCTLQNVVVFSGLIIHTLSAKFGTSFLVMWWLRKFSSYNLIITDIMQNLILHFL